MRFALNYLRNRPQVLLTTANAVFAWLMVAVTGDPLCLCWAMIATVANGVACQNDE